MSLIKKIIGCIRQPAELLRFMSRNGMLFWLHDEAYIKIIYRLKFHKKLNLDNPETFNEKLQWLKLNERTAKYTMMVDKLAVKDYVAQMIGAEHVIPTLGVWERAEDIDFDALPEKFVLKCNHDSSSIIFCKDKARLNKEEAIQKLNYCLKNNGYWYGREWPYKNVKPLIFAEQYMESKEAVGDSLLVYKFLTFNGEPRIVQTIQNDKQPNETIDYFDCEWNLLDMKQNFPNSEVPLPRPERLKEMVDYARMMSAGFSVLRVDLYEIDGEIYFSEFTFFSDDGMRKFTPEKWDAELGSWIKLPKA